MRLSLSLGLMQPVKRSGVSLPHVADANARLSIDPTGKIPGEFQVIQDADSGSGEGVTYTWNGPSSALTAAFVSGTDAAISDGVFTRRGTLHGKDYFNLLGHSDGATTYSISWDSDTAQWEIHDGSHALLWRSSENVTYPWQVVEWIDNGGGTLPTVISVTQGELDAGIEDTNIGEFPTDILIRSTGLNGRPNYTQIGGLESMAWNGSTKWVGGGGNESADNVAVPFQATIWSKAPVNRNDMAAPTNWTPRP